MRVLITGAEGFTGHYMAAELRRAGHEVHCLVRHANALATVDRGYAADLNDMQALRPIVESVKPQWLVHLAAIAFVAHGDAAEIYRTNVIGSRNLLQAMCDSSERPEKVLLASSANVYGNVAALQIDESMPPQPENDYAVSKLAMEFVARLYGDRLPIVVVRPFNYTGVGQSLSFLLPKVVDHFRRRADVIQLGNLDVARDFLDVRTVVGYYRRLLESPASVGQTVNISSGRARLLGEVIDMVRKLAAHDIEVRIDPAFVRQHEVKTLCGNPAKLHSLVGRVDPIDLEATLRWMVDAP